MQVREAIAFAAEGGQALHMMTGGWANGWGGPKCFRMASEFAHLIDQDEARLRATAAKLGVRKIVVSRQGQSGQHVDLCGAPLRKAKLIAMSDSQNGKLWGY